MERPNYVVNKYEIPTKRYCQTMDLVDNKDLIEQYCKLHSKEMHWKEIRDGIREVGILDMDIYICSNHLFMMVETAIDFDWETSFDRLSKLPRQKEWEMLVSKFQVCSDDQTSSEKWIPMDRIFTLYE